MRERSKSRAELFSLSQSSSQRLLTVSPAYCCWSSMGSMGSAAMVVMVTFCTGRGSGGGRSLEGQEGRGGGGGFLLLLSDLVHAHAHAGPTRSFLHGPASGGEAL